MLLNIHKNFKLNYIAGKEVITDFEARKNMKNSMDIFIYN